jgi:hypothetical protein
MRPVRAAWDWFLLAPNERLAAACPSQARDEVRALFQEGRERARVAGRLLEGHPESALALYREAAILLMAAAVAARSGATPPEPLAGADVLARFLADVGQAALGGAPRLEAFLERLRAPEARVDRTPAAEARLIGQAGRAAVRRVAALVEPRGVEELRFMRRARLYTLGAAAFAFVAWGGVSLATHRTNLALHKPVTVNGVHPQAKSPPAGLTDGVTDNDYGVHTSVSDAPWVSVDLGDVHAIDKIIVYNRGDGWWDCCLPMTLQLSENDKDFTDVEKQTRVFGQRRPWVVEIEPPRRARYVRIRGAAGKYIALTELEVFGDRK